MAAVPKSGEGEVPQEYAKKIMFVGNPGTGKSTLVNCWVGKQVFHAAPSYTGKGITYQLDGVPWPSADGQRILYLDTPGLADVVLRKQAAAAINESLLLGGKFHITFVFALTSGRIQDQDVTTLKLVLDATVGQIQENQYSIIINQVPPKFHRQMQEGNRVQEFLATLMETFRLKNIPPTTNVHWNLKDEELEGEINKIQPLPADTLEFLSNLPEIVINSEEVKAVAHWDFDELAEQLEAAKKHQEEMQADKERAEREAQEHAEARKAAEEAEKKAMAEAARISKENEQKLLELQKQKEHAVGEAKQQVEAKEKELKLERIQAKNESERLQREHAAAERKRNEEEARRMKEHNEEIARKDREFKETQRQLELAAQTAEAKEREMKELRDAAESVHEWKAKMQLQEQQNEKIVQQMQEEFKQATEANNKMREEADRLREEAFKAERAREEQRRRAEEDQRRIEQQLKEQAEEAAKKLQAEMEERHLREKAAADEREEKFLREMAEKEDKDRKEQEKRMLEEAERLRAEQRRRDEQARQEHQAEMARLRKEQEAAIAAQQADMAKVKKETEEKAEEAREAARRWQEDKAKLEAEKSGFFSKTIGHIVKLPVVAVGTVATAATIVGTGVTDGLGVTDKAMDRRIDQVAGSFVGLCNGINKETGAKSWT